MPIRRYTDPNIVQHIWDAIKLAVVQHQIADYARISKYLQNVTFCTQEQAESYVNFAKMDHLILELQKVGNKGSKVGVPVDCFKIPIQESPKPVDDGKDWYCIECHLAGNVQNCAGCHRVFHLECSKNAIKKEILFSNAKRSTPQPTLQMNQNNVQDRRDGESNEHDQKQDTQEPPAPPPLQITSNDEGSSGDLVSTLDQFLNEITPINDNARTEYDELLCCVCNLHNLEDSSALEKEDLNHLLQFTLERIKSWLPTNISHKMDPIQQERWIDNDLEWRAGQLWYQNMNMGILQEKILRASYNTLSEFQADVITIQHNVAIFHGFDSQEYGAAELMFRDCCHDLTELRVCADCYRHSNEKLHDNWFCLPCKIPHRLVWAKQKGYPYWPAKVIKETETHVDVRFFGGKYERSFLSKSSIKPIETPKEKLQIKNTAAFKRALNELQLHRTLLSDPSAAQQLIASAKKRSKKKATPKKPKVGNSPRLSERSPINSPVAGDVYSFSEEEKFVGGLPKIFKRKSSTSTETPLPKKEKKISNNGNTDDYFNSLNSSTEDKNVIYVGNASDNSFEQVSSSTECFNAVEDNVMQELDKPYSDVIEKMRRKLELAKDKTQLITIAMNYMREEMDRMQAEHSDTIKKLNENHSNQISETKRKQWCYNCQQDAIYHCCWNTAYCSPNCQQQHWQAEHKKVCRRKRDK